MTEFERQFYIGIGQVQQIQADTQKMLDRMKEGMA